MPESYVEWWRMFSAKLLYSGKGYVFESAGPTPYLGEGDF
jgi:hypothetical protein